MFKMTRTYTDYNGTKRTGDFYFNLNEAEIIEMQIGTVGGFAETIERIIKANNEAELMRIFKELVLKAYGEKTPDGMQFMKVDENGRPLSIKFSQTPVYSDIFMELATNAKTASEFVNGIIPGNIDKNKLEEKRKEIMSEIGSAEDSKNNFSVVSSSTNE